MGSFKFPSQNSSIGSNFIIPDTSINWYIMTKYHATLERFDKTSDKQTLGVFNGYKDNNHIFHCKTLELAWKNNERRISCIPEGVYLVKPYSSDKYPKVYEITEVDSRDKILIHAGNFHRDILGCVILGKYHSDIDGDGLRDVTSSKTTVNKLIDSFDYQEFELTII